MVYAVRYLPTGNVSTVTEELFNDLAKNPDYEAVDVSPKTPAPKRKTTRKKRATKATGSE